jgi:predicted amidophosphoribosyltransferase
MRLIDLVTPAAPPLCVACLAWAGAAEPLCAECRRMLRWLGPDPVAAGALEVWAPLAYDGPARRVVAALKFRGAVRTADAMAAPMFAAAPPGWLDADFLVPAPLHPARRRKRGFNQAERIARALSDRGGGRPRVCDCLVRAGSRTTQMGRGRSQRLTGIAGSVGLRSPPPDGTVLLVDDVVTTGATLAACARALRAAGVRGQVRAIAYARTPGR